MDPFAKHTSAPRRSTLKRPNVSLKKVQRSSCRRQGEMKNKGGPTITGDLFSLDVFLKSPSIYPDLITPNQR